jgi:hypothetical protein
MIRCKQSASPAPVHSSGVSAFAGICQVPQLFFHSGVPTLPMTVLMSAADAVGTRTSMIRVKVARGGGMDGRGYNTSNRGRRGAS